MSPTSLSFGNQVQGTASAVKKLTLKNGQTKAVTVTSITSSLADYTQTNTCPVPPLTLGAGKSCTISVSFDPSALGLRSANLTVTETETSSPQTVSLSGTGVASVTASPSSIVFGSLVVGVKSGAFKVTVVNNQSSALTIKTISTTLADYTITTTCPTGTTPLAAHTSCSISVFFAPTVAGTRTDVLTVSTAIGVSPTVALSGTGIVAVSVLPGSLNFGSQALGTSSAPQTVVLTNNQTISLKITSVASNLADFTTATTCPIKPNLLAAGGSCTASVTFSPKALNTRAGTLSFSDNASSSPQTVSLNGTGVGANLVSIAVAPVNSSIVAGNTQQFSATGNYSDGSTQNLTSSVTWSSSSVGIGTINSTGLAKGIASGTTSVTATSGSISGSTTLTVTGAQLVSIAISPANSSIAKGTNEPLKATGTYTDGSTQDLTNSVSWSCGEFSGGDCERAGSSFRRIDRQRQSYCCFRNDHRVRGYFCNSGEPGVYRGNSRNSFNSSWKYTAIYRHWNLH